jgi:hypothetical protein
MLFKTLVVESFTLQVETLRVIISATESCTAAPALSASTRMMSRGGA